MPIELYILLTWTTRRRVALIDSATTVFLRRFLPTVASRFGEQVLALGVVNNHVHAVLRCERIIDLPRLVQALKGASARVANRDGVTATKLRWADGYDARSISPRALADAIAYVRGQAKHHPLDAVERS